MLLAFQSLKINILLYFIIHILVNKNKLFILKNNIKLSSNYDYKFIYLDYSDFWSDEGIYLYFQISDDSMNNYIEYTNSDDSPNFEEEFSSFNHKNYERIEKYIG